MNPILEDILMHVGVSIKDGAPGPGSGRYPLGSGKKPFQRPTDFLSRVEQMKRDGFSQTQIAESFGITTTQLRAQQAIAKNERRSAQVARARELRDQGYSLNQIADMMGFENDSSVRSLLNANSEARMNQAMKTADFLRDQVNSKGMIDVGVGVEKELGVSSEKLREALAILESEGYEIYGGGVPQATNPGKQTNLKVLCPPGTPHKDIYNYSEIHSVADYASHDGGDTFDKLKYPESMDISRLMIQYAEEGGKDKDGVIEIRRGVADLSLGDSHYAQVRILVDGDRYLKGMAVYADDLPPGIDVRFNTNKSSDKAPRDVLKPITDDPDNPFGSLIKANGQSYYIDENGNRKLSLINKRAEEGDWGEWSDRLPSQFLAKQSLQLIDKQLTLAKADKEAEFNDICALTNPTVKRQLLQSFADDCDASAVHLDAAALPRQKYQVILPEPTLKDNEVYAPNYIPGEKVALIRFPHGGTFEIPILTVNNKNQNARDIIGTNAKDAVAINSKVAARLSGADFDGDTVMVIPISAKARITSTPALKDLESFDPKLEYPERKGMRYMKRTTPDGKVIDNTQKEMGIISNLITDMTLKGATDEELVRAVRHSMVVIDAAKHKLDYKQSEKDNNIAELKRLYQTRVDEDGVERIGGASTLLSRAKNQTSVVKRQGTPKINPDTGELIYKEADDAHYVDKKTGEVKTRHQVSTQMAETKDAHTLSSGTLQEERYADYANSLKDLANRARKEMVNTGRIKYSSSANKIYKEQVDSLNAKLNVALKNAPRERQAQLIANSVVNAKKLANPDMSEAEIKKESQRALSAARAQVNAKRSPVDITEKEWEAIQSGAISDHKLEQILNNTNIDVVRKYATPRSANTLSDAKINQIKALSSSGYTNQEIADRLDLSSTTISKYL